MKGIESAWRVPCKRCGALVNFGDAQSALLDEWGYAHASCAVCHEENILFALGAPDIEEPKRMEFPLQVWVPILLALLILALMLLLLPVFQPAPKRKGYDPGLFASTPRRGALLLPGGKR